jgi:imidazolonepropionase-like amidohydrolase
MIDLHIHAYASDVSLPRVDKVGHAHRTAHAVRMLGHALDCGFTSVRDCGGGDWSLANALREGLIRGPRFFYAGKIISMTGGHGDFRTADMVGGSSFCSCGSANSLSTIADGVDQCVAAAREQFRRGAHMIKIMGSGGIVSPTDPIWMSQYGIDEIRSIVAECEQRRSYASAHCHPANAIRRCVENGVRCIEHGTLIDDATAAFVAEAGAYVVPTMAILFGLAEHGRSHALDPEVQAKLEVIQQEALGSLERMRRAKVKLGFGTDLVGSMYVNQCREFDLRSEVFSPIEILRQATSTGAEILQMEGELGCVAEGALADLLVIESNPLRDLSVLARNGECLDLIMSGGKITKDRVSA